MTIADLVERVERGELGYTRDYRRKVLGALRAMDRHPLFDRAPLARITVDLDDFARRAGKGPVRILSSDTYFYEIWRHPVLRIEEAGCGCGC